MLTLSSRGVVLSDHIAPGKARQCVKLTKSEQQNIKEILLNIFRLFRHFIKQMGFRFRNINSMCRTYITRVSSQSNNYYHPIIQCQSLNFHFQNHPSSVCSNQHYLKIPIRWHFGHSQDHHQQLSGKDAENIFRLGLASDVGLAAGKALTGYLSGSTAIIADAAHSISDVVFFICPFLYIIFLC